MNGLEFKDFFSKHAGRFTQHIDKSIPGYAENREATVLALARTLPRGAKVLDVGASDGTFGDMLLAVRSDIAVTNIDPNPDMIANYKGTAEYRLESWVEGFKDPKVGWIDEHYSPFTYDVIHMSMVRQFVTDNAALWYHEAWRQLKDGGLFVVNTKVSAPLRDDGGFWQHMEYLKDQYKAKSFSPEEITEKAAEVLEGMHQHMIPHSAEREALKRSFRHVGAYWSSYNFHGFVASDSKTNYLSFVDNYAIEGGY